MTRQILILGGYNCGKTELIRKWLAISERLGLQVHVASPALADLSLPRAEEAPTLESAFYEAEGEMNRPGAKFEQWFTVHNISALCLKYGVRTPEGTYRA